MSKFHNPYHFVPLANELHPHSVEFENAGSGRTLRNLPAQLIHSSFVSKTVDGMDVRSGRIVCRLTVVELLAVGASQTDPVQPTSKRANNGKPREISLFKLDGQFAIPGSSLRGMLGSLVEAASNSALRILENNEFELSNGRGNARVKLGKTYAYFKAFSNESTPLEFADTRRKLTIAEAILGVVENVPKNKSPSENWKAFNLAGRVRFANALPHGPQPEQADKKETTQILDSPYPPSPALYFRPNLDPDGAFINRLGLNKTNPAVTVPQGRKMYLHRKKLEDRDWQTVNPKDQAHQKATVAPLKNGEFWFHIDFDNLSELELSLLSYALAPSARFHHKLGMGKGLGLGKVKLEVAFMGFVNRKARYLSEPLDAERYSLCWKRDDLAPYPPFYEQEFESDAKDNAPHNFAGKWKESVKGTELESILNGLELLGDPERITHPVHYPQPMKRKKKDTQEGKESGDNSLVDVTGVEMERNHYEWWQQNETIAGQFLRPLTATNTCNFAELPTLERAPSNAPPTPSCGSGAKPSSDSPPLQKPEGLVGTKQNFVLVENKTGKRSRLRFSLTVGGKAINGFLQDQSKIQLIRSRPLDIGKTSFAFAIKSYDGNSFQLDYPGT